MKKYQLPQLPYDYDVLEPFIDTKTMEIHHQKHHQAYVNNLNIVLEKYPQINADLEVLLKDLSLVPEEARTAVRNNGGGHYNHSFFWQILQVNNGAQPIGKLKEWIERDYQSVENLKDQIALKAKTVFGSGWAWLILNHHQKLEVVSTANQDTVLNLGYPLLGIDVWEHAYYLHYQNRRPDYIEAFYNVVNWQQVAKNLEEALLKKQ
ncbi:Superoxide dismutase [Candidatus Phytoplasma pruni]|uniref:Superoxide dismutase n=1 Tax=Candidatus Phytoplasma pruni TaxID=479893 RepID=A0A0M1N0N9_9MOLU|nr:superoxide dismutase [Candidatus Phytoplasma pruni]KOR75519.1 Superoxide dismutase [Candidatus Phytoplasma pruni]MCQ9618488.1 Superoxide dismutase [Candidatus Phytoplasma pruni]MDW3617947.1 superoxide dismutase [Candidatus Phytoplasma pruni]